MNLDRNEMFRRHTYLFARNNSVGGFQSRTKWNCPRAVYINNLKREQQYCGKYPLVLSRVALRH